MRVPLFIGAVIGLAFVACTDKSEPRKTPAEQFAGWYRAVLSSSEGMEIPFFISLPTDPTTGGAVIMNGKQWFSAPHHWDEERLTVDFPIYRSKIVATIGAKSALIGTWRNNSRAWAGTSLGFRAERVPKPDPEIKFRTPSSPPPEVDLAGTWKLEMAKSGVAKLVITKESETAIGATLWFNNGVTEFVFGNVIGKRAILSSFDGVSPYLLSLELTDGRLKGEWSTSPDLSEQQKLTGERSADFPLQSTLRVSAPDNRIRLPELDHPRYAGQPVVVQLVGSWCAHCKTAAPVISELYEKYQPKGLRVMTIDYEFTEDSSYNLQRAAQFKNEYGITWQLITRDGRVDEFWDILPNGLAGDKPFVAFPITIFLKRNGTIHALHAGFVGPESGEPHEALKARFDRWAAEILE